MKRPSEEPRSYYVCCYERGVAFYIVQAIGLILGAIGMVLTLVVTIMPQWRVSIHVESNPVGIGHRVDGIWMDRWDGLWTTCFTQNNIPMQCNSYESMVSLTTDLKAGRALMSLAVIIAVISYIIGIVGILFNKCFRENEGGRNCLLLTAGIGYILAGILVLIVLSWTASNIILQANNPVCKGAQRQELGEAIFLGCPTTLFLLIAGIILCWTHPCGKIRRIHDDYLRPSNQPQPMYELSTMDRRPVGNYSRSEYL